LIDDKDFKELMRVSKENNILLKRLIYSIAQSSNNQYLKDFIVNFIANIAADKYQGNSKI